MPFGAFVGFFGDADDECDDDDDNDGDDDPYARVCCDECEWSLAEIDCVVKSSAMENVLLELFSGGSGALGVNGSEMLSEEISLPLPESGESLDRPCALDNDGKKSKSVGRVGSSFNESN